MINLEAMKVQMQVWHPIETKYDHGAKNITFNFFDATGKFLGDIQDVGGEVWLSLFDRKIEVVGSFNEGFNRVKNYYGQTGGKL